MVVNRIGRRGRASGAPVEPVWTVACQLRDATIVRIEYYPDKEESLKAIGAAELSEQGPRED